MLLRYDWVIWVTSLVVATGTTVFTFEWLKATYDKLFVSLPGTVFSVLGFIITAIAIIVSLRDIGLMQHIYTLKRDWWDKLVKQFFSTSKVLALFGFCLLLFSGVVFSSCHAVYICSLLDRVYYMSFMFLLIFSSLNVLKCVLILEAVVQFSNEN